MNILLATNGNLDRGGITLFMLQWIKGIKQALPDSRVIVYFRESIENAEIAAEFKRHKVSIITSEIPKGVNFKNQKANKKVRDDIKHIILGEKIDVLHINSRMFGFNVLLLSEAKKCGVSVRIAHAHGAISEKLHDKIIHTFMKRRIRSLATLYAGCSKTAGQHLFGKKGVTSSKWRFVPNTIQTERFAFDETVRRRRRESLNVKDDEILLGAIGHLTEVKNHVFLIELLHDLRNRSIPAKLIIIGEGEKRDELQMRCKEYGIEDKVILYGSSSEVPEWLSALDYYLMPSLSEGLPISAVEAQANGLVCLLSDRITREVDLTDNIYHLSISSGVYPWAEMIESTTPVSVAQRLEGVSNVKNAGFDESDTSLYVKKIYIM